MTSRSAFRTLAVAVAVACTLSFAPHAVAAPASVPASAPSKAPTLPKDATTLPDRWIVQVSGSPTADGGSASAATSAQDQVLTEASDDGLTVTRTRSYSTVYNGMSVTASSSDADQLRSVSGVVGVWPVLAVASPDPATTSTGLTSALSMTGADVAYSELGLSGKGVKVGVIDTGIDIDHPDLGGTGKAGTTPFPSPRVRWGYDFVGDSYDTSGASVAQLTPKPDADPDDCNGHGTHVAGIVGANGDFAKGGVRGVAPAVTFGAYRVFGCDGTSSTDVILAAMDRAIADRMDVVTMSLGEPYMSWPSYPTAVAAATMQKAGVILVASAGNEGADGSFTVSAPSVSDSAISVASFDNTQIPAHKVTTSLGTTVPYLPAEQSGTAPTTGTVALAAAGTDGDGSADTACTQVSAAVAGKAALVRRGTCGFYDKALNAQNAGATAVVVVNNQPGLATITTAGDVPITIPVIFVPLAEGTALLTAAASGAVSMTWTSGWITTADPTGGLVSSTSAYGLAADLTLKPDLGAPGGNILSTYPLELGSYAVDSGTSMAAPHVAGAIALLLQAKPQYRGQTTAVRELLQTTGALAAFSGDPTSGALEPVQHQGGGLLQIVTALTTQQTVSPGKISMGEGSAGARTTTVTLTNTASKPVTYTVSSSNGVATLGSLIGDDFFQTANAKVSASRTVTVPARGKATVRVTITPPTSPRTAVYGGWVTFTGKGATTLHIPFAGLVGDYQSVKALAGGGLPSLAMLDGNGDIVPAEAGQVYTMQDYDYPFVLFHLDYPVANVRIDILRVSRRGLPTLIAPNYRSWVSTGPVGKDPDYQYRYFDGTYTAWGRGGQHALANGTYVMVITVTKALADPHSRSAYETWTSPTFSIRQTT